MPLSKDKKVLYFEKLESMLEKYSKVFIVLVDNVGSNQMNQTRLQMRGTAEILMGKNTLIRKVMKNFLDRNPNHPIESLMPKVLGNIGFVFTNSDLPTVRDMILKNRVPAPARVGAIAPLDVTIPAGPTGCDPGQTNFFQVLQIPTKIQKGQIEITNPVNLIKKGDKVGSSEATLLQKLNIRPFSYGLGIDSIYDNGSIFPVAVLDISDAELAMKFTLALNKMAAISIVTGYPNLSSFSHNIRGAFRACVGITCQLDNYNFPKADPYREYLKDPSAFQAAGGGGAAAAPSGDAAVIAPVVAAPAEEEVDALDGGMDMFGGSGGGGDY
mmetsp:Transcript_20136/g.20233  ORF Transcript_20136/g.20233 Transcript_20136/m.20233 type:complete len:327 (+) Transcript_20136:145-1125(+)|eukprot:CAMPEP_0182418654 /NCGR_PEP_ID=MMETSP1167-20130531/3030_1 /TAXON_ID=2988 /ORGANISM="Mallomonas Sp, Strain CCMP3275" /LENGTH=326 /DNA_ID=CAMNT_0024592953 /DNA_START=115 /DNA_END=1095 /DNA_ORIENTATION=+